MTDLVATSRETIQKGSSSFAAAAALFDAQTRADVEMLYAWCRHCDDVIDGQTLGHDREVLSADEVKRRLEALYAQTRSVLAGEPTDDPAFAAFREVARRRGIPERYAIELIDGFAMDVAGRRYQTIDDTLDYCWHVAGVVGAMMAIVMGVEPDDLATLRRAQDLGLAFQLTNIARDIVEDAENGRVYVPAEWLAQVRIAEDAVAAPEHRAQLAAIARRLVGTAEPYYHSARWGLRGLPFRSGWAVAAALGVYREIGVKVARKGPAAWDERVSTSTGEKVRLALGGGLMAARGATLDRWGKTPPRPPLWSKI